MYHVYVLKSEKDDGLYIGQTNDLAKRLQRHNLGKVRSTAKRKPMKVIYSEKYQTRQEAMAREGYLKRLKGGNELKRILGKI